MSQETHESILRLKKKHLGLLKADAVGKLLSIATTATLHCVRPLEEHKPQQKVFVRGIPELSPVSHTIPVPQSQPHSSQGAYIISIWSL